MDHEDARRIASLALDEPLSQAQERELAMHLISCAECKTYYDDLARARSAFRRVRPSTVRSEVLDTTVWRATTVLAGDADPGSVRDGEPLELQQNDEDTGPMVAVGEPEPPVPPPHDTEPVLIEPPAEQEPEPAEAAQEGSPEPEPEPESEPTQDIPAASRETSVVLVNTGIAPPEPATEEVYEVQSPADQPPIAPDHEPIGRERQGAGPWIAAILVTALVAGLAGFLFVRGPQLFEGAPADLPPAQQIQSRVGAAFDDLRSLKASYSITRLNLYRLRREDDRLVYSFSNGTLTGRAVYEDPDRSRDEWALEVGGRQLDRQQVARTPEETRTLIGEGEEARMLVLANPPLGPPDGPLATHLGSLEYAVGSAVRLLVDARDVRVIERAELDEREVYRIAFTVAPTAFTRADRIEMLIDPVTSFPVQIRRSIERADAGVLGPSELLDEDAIDQAFGDRDRITTETVEVAGVVINDVVLPGEFALDAPSGAEVETQDAAFAEVTLAELDEETPFAPLLPTNLPQGFRERAFQVYTGEERAWGPEDTYPAPEGIVQIAYSDGKSTIVVSQRRIADGAFELTESPLAGVGLPLTTAEEVRGGRRFVYAISPEVPPHVYGFVDDVFVMVSGYVPRDDLLRIAGSLSDQDRTADVEESPEPDTE